MPVDEHKEIRSRESDFSKTQPPLFALRATPGQAKKTNKKLSAGRYQENGTTPLSLFELPPSLSAYAFA
jgi:hypothetical protein